MVTFLSKYFSSANENKNNENIEIKIDGNKVNKENNELPTNQPMKEWATWADKKVLSYMTQAQLLDKMRKW